METLRTTTFSTNETQAEFYKNVVCNPKSEHRYVGLHADGGAGFIGMGGITNIQWENRIGEISLLLDPAYRGQGLGLVAVRRLLKYAFHELNLQTVCGECYMCNPDGREFWKKVMAEYRSEPIFLPNRKYWNGEYHCGIYFSIDKGDYEAAIQQAGN